MEHANPLSRSPVGPAGERQQIQQRQRTSKARHVLNARRSKYNDSKQRRFDSTESERAQEG